MSRAGTPAQDATLLQFSSSVPIGGESRNGSKIMDERRAPRTHFAAELTGEVTVFRPLSVSDLSPHGARVETSDALRVGAIRAFRLNLGDQTVVVNGRILHARVRTLDTRQIVYTCGVEFVEVSSAVQAAIADYLSRAGTASVAGAAAGDPE